MTQNAARLKGLITAAHKQAAVIERWDKGPEQTRTAFNDN
jgi:hypothetical protein